jgi:uncharacterized NAD(P)/FAD-binding protein YdhS
MQTGTSAGGTSVAPVVRDRGAALNKRQSAFDHIAVCGGGASAVLLLHALRKHADRPLDVTIVEERPLPGTGLAYSTPSPSHLLNVPAGRMSADAADPNEFVAWLGDNASADGYTAKSFVPRRLYGAYLKNLLATASMDRRSNVQVKFRRGTVRALDHAARHWTLGLTDGTAIAADAVVVATGNAPPRPCFGADTAVSEHIINDPWDAAAKVEIPRNANVALIGSGLTAVDIAMELLDKGHRGQIRLISRHGLLPRKHAPAMVSASWLHPPYPSSIAELMRRTRDEAHSIPGQEAWRTAIDALRPHLPAIWNALSDADKARFLRHVRPFWEVHRHRMAPEVAVRIEQAIEDGRIAVQQGRLLAIESAAPGGLKLKVKTQGKVVGVAANVAINCTGPECNPLASRNPLIVDLLQKGLARPDPLHLGLDTDTANRMIAANGTAQQGLFAMGPVARGRLWEVTAIPEIRHQATQLAHVLAPLASERADAYTI